MPTTADDTGTKVIDSRDYYYGGYQVQRLKMTSSFT